MICRTVVDTYFHKTLGTECGSPSYVKIAPVSSFNTFRSVAYNHPSWPTSSSSLKGSLREGFEKPFVWAFSYFLRAGEGHGPICPSISANTCPSSPTISHYSLFLLIPFKPPQRLLFFPLPEAFSSHPLNQITLGPEHFLHTFPTCLVPLCLLYDLLH